MKIKTYRSESVPKALDQIRKDLGDGALILSTRRTKKRRLLGLVPSMAYEITAASESDASGEAASDALLSRRAARQTYEVADDPPRAPKARPPALRKASSREGLNKPGGADASKDLQPRMERLSDEVRRLKRMVSRRSNAASAPWALALAAQDGSGSPQAKQTDWKMAQASARLMTRLISDGMDEGLAHSLLSFACRQVPAGRTDPEAELEIYLRTALERMLETAPIPEPRQGSPRAAIFIGPTGVGKTTTIAKLAAVFSLGEGRRVQLLTLDTYRIAAAEQLKTYADIIGVPIRVLHSVEELDEAVQDVGDRNTVLIDTSGHSHKNTESYRPLADFLRKREDIEKHLVLSMTTKAEDLREMMESFAAFSPDKLVFTKLDETSSFGALSEGILSGHPISYLTNGQAVPDDLQVPSPQSVAELIVRGA